MINMEGSSLLEKNSNLSFVKIPNEMNRKLIVICDRNYTVYYECFII